MSDWLKETRALRLVAADLNGVGRGKRMPIEAAEKTATSGSRFPFSALNVDIWGEDIEDSPLVLESGDRDGFLYPTERGLLPVPWLTTPTAMQPIWMFDEDGTPFDGDPRHALAAVEQRYTDKGLQPVVATELEFYLVALSDTGELTAPKAPMSQDHSQIGNVLSVWELDRFDPFLTALYDGCAAMGIPAETATSEVGVGQFEFTLTHQASAIKAADDTWFFKMLVKGLARQHGFAATFMAKPYLDQAGTGLHMHFSVLDGDGRNVFDDGTDTGTPMLHHAIGGCLDALADSTVIFAPHANSYARLVPGAHAPTGVCWAYENRTVAVRVPSGPGVARRIEHRCAGGDVNPYLSIAAVLGAALNGIEDAQTPPLPITGNAYDQDMPQMHANWTKAIDAFAQSPQIARIF
ncbi:MAG: glutamine synthetase, partial [Rhodobacteraceae bacterium]|nr:glutamine synthetase [Paracoccaceae bacterium]